MRGFYRSTSPVFFLLSHPSPAATNIIIYLSSNSAMVSNLERHLTPAQTQLRAEISQPHPENLHLYKTTPGWGFFASCVTASFLVAIQACCLLSVHCACQTQVCSCLLCNPWRGHGGALPDLLQPPLAWAYWEGLRLLPLLKYLGWAEWLCKWFQTLLAFLRKSSSWNHLNKETC